MANVLILDEENAAVGLQAILIKRKHLVTSSEKIDSIEEALGQVPVDLWIVEPDIAGSQEAYEKLRTIMKSAMQKSHIVVCTSAPYEAWLSEHYGLQRMIHYHECFKKPIDPEYLLKQMHFKLD